MTSIKKTVTKKKQPTKVTAPVKKAVVKKAAPVAKKAAPEIKKIAPVAKKTTSAVKPAAKKRSVEVLTSGMQKEYVKNNKECKVTFKLPKIAAPSARSVCLVGEFNEWNIYASPMKKGKDGNYTLTLQLKAGKEYQFRYFIDESSWENDWNADKYVQSPVGGSENSVVVV